MTSNQYIKIARYLWATGVVSLLAWVIASEVDRPVIEICVLQFVSVACVASVQVCIKKSKNH